MITALDKKYRPGTLDEVIGQDAIVTQLKGIVKSGKWPSAIAFFGPTSAGKTTLARALAASAFGIERVPKSHSDYAEHNAADAKTKEDVNGLIALGAIRPQQAKRGKRFWTKRILKAENQAWDAAQAWLQQTSDAASNK